MQSFLLPNIKPSNISTGELPCVYRKSGKIKNAVAISQFIALIAKQLGKNVE
jgi:hypothetical protein